jgi:hypothetical protein
MGPKHSLWKHSFCSALHDGVPRYPTTLGIVWKQNNPVQSMYWEGLEGKIVHSPLQSICIGWE